MRLLLHSSYRPPEAETTRPETGPLRLWRAVTAVRGLRAILVIFCGLLLAPSGSVLAAEAPAQARKYMVAAANPLAAEAGLGILRAGGSAVDAAIATQLVLGLVEPQSSGLGGGAFLLHFDAGDGSVAAYDGRETAPAAATPELFLSSAGEPMDFWSAVVGGRSVGVPGLIRMLEMAHNAHGRLPWRALFAPAIELAETGFPVSPRLNMLLTRERFLASVPASASYFYDESGQPWPVGHILKNPAYAQTLRRLAEAGADAFYSGPIAAEIVAAVTGAPSNAGALAPEDLATYSARSRQPLCARYRAWRVCGMPPPTSGGLAVLQILGILAQFDLPALRANTAEAVHLIAEASRLAFADRNQFLGDPDFVDVPVADLLDPGYLARRATQISSTTTMGRARPGLPLQNGEARKAVEPPSTTHLAVVDADGNAVSMTSSIESAFGSRLMAAGFLLNNELTDFSFAPEAEGRPVANRVEPGKRPRSSMSPMLVFDPQGRLVLAIGTPGGSRIIGYVAKALIAVLDWRMDVQAAISLPNFVNRNGPTDLEENRDIVALAGPLAALGHEVVIRALESGLHGIARLPDGTLTGGADPRREGVALGD